MICSICKKGDTSVVDSRPTEEDFAFVVHVLLHLKEFNLGK